MRGGDMNLVIDTSILIAVIANEPVKGKLTAVTQQADLIAPGSVHWEVGNALSAMMRRKRISGEQAAKALLSYQQIPIRLSLYRLMNPFSWLINSESMHMTHT